jgi:serine protease Do
MAPEEASTPELNHSQAGLGVEDIPSELEALIGLKRGEGAWVVRVEGGSPASEAGILPGDVILALNQISVKSASHFKKLTREHPLETTWLITLQRGTEGNRAFVVISRQNPGQIEGP